MLKNNRVSRGFACALMSVVAVAASSHAASSKTLHGDGRINPAGVVRWSPGEQQQAFRSFDSLYATRTIRKGTHVTPLPLGRTAIVHFESGGRTFDTSSFMQANMIAGLLLLKNGAVVTERYALGFTSRDRWASFSVEKSIVSTLIGAAIQDGSIRSVQDSASHYVPALRHSPLDGVTLQELLEMSSGMQWNEEYQDSPDVDFIVNTWAMRRKGVLFPYIASRPRAWPPGTRFQYNSANTQVLLEVLESATHMNPSAYLSEKIWKPLGMQGDASWQLDSDGGMEAGSISATLRDYGRFGLFIANGGAIDGVRVLPSGWIVDSTRGSRVNPLYGYGWWIGKGGVFSALGLYGQEIYVDRSRRFVAVILGVSKTPVISKAHEERTQAFLRAAESVLETTGNSPRRGH